MYHADGIGLAGPQVGVSRRVLVVDLGEADEDGVGAIALVNPKGHGSQPQNGSIGRGLPEHSRDGGGGGETLQRNR